MRHILLDSTPLALVSNPAKSSSVISITTWLNSCLAAGNNGLTSHPDSETPCRLHAGMPDCKRAELFNVTANSTCQCKRHQRDYGDRARDDRRDGAYGNDQWDTVYPDTARFLADIEAGALYAAVEAGRLHGFISIDQDEPEGYENLPWANAGGFLVIHRFAVAGRSREQGIASLLEQFACRLAVESGLRHFKVDTHSSNIGMQTFLTKRGYEKVGEIEFRGKDRPFFCYEKVLT